MVKLFGCEHVLFFQDKGENDPEGNSEIIGPASLVSKCEGGGDTTSFSTTRQWSSGTLWVGSPGAVGW